MHNVSHDYQLSHKWATIYHINTHPRICEKHTDVRVGKALTINLCILYTNIVIQRTL